MRNNAYHPLKLTCCDIKHRIVQRGYWIFSLFLFDVGRFFHWNKKDILGRKYTLVFKNRLLNKWHFITSILSRGLEPSVGTCFSGMHGNSEIAVNFKTLYFIYSLTYKSTSSLVAAHSGPVASEMCRIWEHITVNLPVHNLPWVEKFWHVYILGGAYFVCPWSPHRTIRDVTPGPLSATDTYIVYKRYPSYTLRKHICGSGLWEG
jgi:hypothetical protein